MKEINKDLIIYLDDEPVVYINSQLLDRQDCWDNLEKIKLAHLDRVKLELEMEKCECKEELIRMNDIWTDLQFLLQDLWGFTKDARFHRFWDVPGCTCCKLDNEDMYPTGRYIISSDCKIHGNLLTHKD